MKKPFYTTLYFKVLLGLVLGVVVGFVKPDIGVELKPLGDGFINLIKMIITPVIFCTVAVGIAGMESLKTVGRVGGKTLLYFEVVTTLALIIGLVVVNLIQPGAGINADPATLDAGKYAAAKAQTTMEFLMGIIPNSVVGAFAQGNLLQVLLFSVLFGVSLSAMGEKGKPILATLERFGHALLGVVNIVMKLAPIGAFGAIAFTIGKYGIGTLAQLGKLVACLYLTSGLFIVVVLGLISWFSGISLWRLVCYIKEEIFIVLGTASTESVLPRMMEKLEALGCRKSIVGLVLPTGYSFNLDGAAIYLTMASMFIAQAMNIDLSLGQQLGLLAILLLTSKGGAGVAGAALIALAATLSATSIIPVAGMALVIGIDRILNEVRAVTNLIGNCVATVAIARWEGAFDRERAEAVLSGRLSVEECLEEGRMPEEITAESNCKA
jgi:aerobic C4-dicarboxylate transport protein